MKVSHLVALLSSSTVVLALPGWVTRSASLVSRPDDNQKNGTDDSLVSSGLDHPEDDKLRDNDDHPQATETRPKVPTSRRCHGHGRGRGRGGHGRGGRGRGGRGRGRKGKGKGKDQDCDDDDDPAVATSTPDSSPFGLIGNGTFFGNSTFAGNSTALNATVTTSLTSDDAATATATITDDNGGDNSLLSTIEARALEILDAALRS